MGEIKRWNGYQGYDGGQGSDGEFKKTGKPQWQMFCRLWRKQKYREDKWMQPSYWPKTALWKQAVQKEQAYNWD